MTFPIDAAMTAALMLVVPGTLALALIADGIVLAGIIQRWLTLLIAEISR
jgi:hypothetical protein